MLKKEEEEEWRRRRRRGSIELAKYEVEVVAHRAQTYRNMEEFQEERGWRVKINGLTRVSQIRSLACALVEFLSMMTSICRYRAEYAATPYALIFSGRLL